MDEKKTRSDSGKKPGTLKPKKNGEPRKSPPQAFIDQVIRTPEEAREKGRAGGKKSAVVRAENARNKRTAREAVKYLLELAAKGKLDENLKELGFPDEERSNMAALQARLFTMAMAGNLEAYMTLMRMAGYEPEENRKERESVSADRRRDAELDAKVAALGQSPSGMSASLNMKDEDGNNDVVIYMPEIEDPKNLEMDDEQE